MNTIKKSNSEHKKNTFKFTIIFVKDPTLNTYSAFFAQFPNIMAEGDTQDEASCKLIELCQKVFEHQKKKPEIIGRMWEKPFNEIVFVKDSKTGTIFLPD